jgi:hypothetical protein
VRVRKLGAIAEIIWRVLKGFTIKFLLYAALCGERKMEGCY